MADVVVVGLVCRDVVVRVPRLPGSGSVAVDERHEVLGGAANQAVGLVQLGRSATLVGVVGEDDAGRAVLAQARADGIGIDAVVRRPGTATALVVDVVDDAGSPRLLEHLPEGTWLTAGDVHAAAAVIGSGRAVTVEMRQPAAAVADAVRLATGAGALVVADGANLEALAPVLANGAVLRADADEASSLLGRRLDGVADTLDGARELVGAGASLVALGAGEDGNVLAWPGGQLVFPLLGGSPVDPTGGGDAFVTGLVAALLDGADPEVAGWWGSAAAALTVARLGGRPALDRAAVADLARRSATR
ncbi:PfkB family carbohydrate kinase [Georgenia sp. MJ170]|uniref:PfkB family carbohydrate kinase n=1 Tax=Georgenia sunbinii TaxID=3117728 RepID=UPI002F26C5E7